MNLHLNVYVLFLRCNQSKRRTVVRKTGRKLFFFPTLSLKIYKEHRNDKLEMLNIIIAYSPKINNNK